MPVSKKNFTLFFRLFLSDQKDIFYIHDYEKYMGN